MNQPLIVKGLANAASTVRFFDTFDSGVPELYVKARIPDFQQQAARKLLPAGVIGQTVKHTVMVLLRDPILFLCNGGGHPALEYIPQKLPDKLEEAGIHE